MITETTVDEDSIGTRRCTTLAETGQAVAPEPSDHLVCPEGKILHRGSLHSRGGTYQHVPRQTDGRACPVKDSYLPQGQERGYIGLTTYHLVYLKAGERNQTSTYQRE